MKRRKYGFDKEGNYRGSNCYLTKDYLTPTKEEMEAIKKLIKRLRKHKEIKTCTIKKKLKS